MKKYCAHALFVIEQVSGPQEVYPVWENVYLLEAEDFAHAFEVGSRIAKSEEEYTREVYVDDMPALNRFRGIRRVVEVDEDLAQCISLPVSGDGIFEVTHTQFEVRDLKELDRLLEGEDAQVTYVGRSAT